MGDVIYRDFTQKVKTKAKQVMGFDPVPAFWRNFAAQFNLEIELTGSGDSFWVNGKSFTTPWGTRVQSAFAYLRPTGKWREGRNPYTGEKREEVEVVCLQSGNHKYVGLDLLQPFRFIDDLKD